MNIFFSSFSSIDILFVHTAIDTEHGLPFAAAVRVKGGMNLWNGMWHGLRNDIIMRNLIYGKWRKERNSTGRHARVSVALNLAPI